MLYKDEVIVVRFDKEMLKEFSGYDVDNPDAYFKLHPRAKNPPYNGLWGKKRMGLLPSTNKFLNCNDRRIQNDIKQHIADYTTFCLEKQKIKSVYFDKCIVLCVQYKPTKSESDNDNTWVKSSLDAMTEYEIWPDDNYKHMKLYQSYSIYCKEDPRTELIIFPIYDGEYDFDFVVHYVAQYISDIENAGGV